MRIKSVYAITAAALALGFGMGVAVGQNAPTDNKGVKISPPAALDLGGEGRFAAPGRGEQAS
jgi:hypothetical protein